MSTKLNLNRLCPPSIKMKHQQRILHRDSSEDNFITFSKQGNSSKSIFACESDIELLKIRESVANLLENIPESTTFSLYTPKEEAQNISQIENDFSISPLSLRKRYHQKKSPSAHVISGEVQNKIFNGIK